MKPAYLIASLVAVVLVGAVLYVGITDDGDSHGPQFDSLDDLAAAINEAGWGCAQPEPDTPDLAAEEAMACQVVAPGSEPESGPRGDGTVTCEPGSHLGDDGLCHSDNNAMLTSFRDASQQESWVQLAGDMGCPVMQDMAGVNEMHFVQGDGWVASVGSGSEQDPELVAGLAEDLAAEHTTISC